MKKKQLEELKEYVGAKITAISRTNSDEIYFTHGTLREVNVDGTVYIVTSPDETIFIMKHQLLKVKLPNGRELT